MTPDRDIIDEIDELVDWQLSGGDQSDTFHGTGWRENHPCPWCVEGYHFLPITLKMWEMRQGSYAQDEFGQGIVDPDYRFEDDDSPILCPGSEVHGPEEIIAGARVWGKQSRERVKKRSGGAGRSSYPTPPPPSLPAGRRRRLRFHAPFRGWIVSLDDERVIEDVYSHPAFVGLPGPPSRLPLVVDHRLTATFEPEYPIRNPSQEWLERNMHDVVDRSIRVTPNGTFVDMVPVVIPFAHFTVHAEDPQANEPDWIEFETTYDIARHPWFLELWADRLTIVSEGHEPDYAIIDEHYQFTEEELRRHVEDTTDPQAGRIIEWTTAQTSDQAER